MENKNILIVEDEAIVSLDLKKILNKIGYIVLDIFRSGEEAIAFMNASSKLPDLILMDVILAGSLSGTQTISEIKKKNNIPVIYITAYSDNATVKMASETDPFGYILKPFDEKTIRIAVDLALYKHKLQLSLEESERRQKELNDAKDKFFSLISHDLRSPFNSMLGFIEILKDEYNTLSENERSFFINAVYSSAKNIYDQLNDLLEYSGFKTGIRGFKPARINLQKLVMKAVEMQIGNALKKNIDIVFRIPEEIYIYGGEDMMLSVFQNLVSNSIKFTDNNGCIKINASVNGKFIECEVNDNGIGMSEEILNNLFKPEFKQSTPGTNNETGTGLGLLIVKEFIEKNSGTINVTSTPGIGTSFFVKIPKV